MTVRLWTEDQCQCPGGDGGKGGCSILGKLKEVSSFRKINCAAHL